MKKICIYSLIALFFTSCGSQLRTDINTTAEDVSYSTELEYLLSGIVRDIGIYYTESGLQHGGDYYDWFSPTMQYSQLLQGGERANNYQYYTNPPDNWREYNNQLQALDSGLKIAKTRERPVYSAVLNILRVFTFAFVTDRHGDIPYSQALKGREDIFFPAYDAQSSIYKDFLVQLDNAVELLKTTPDYFDLPNYDLMYKGDKNKWIRFANSLKLRLLVRAHDALQKEGVNVNNQIQALANGGMLINETDQSASFVYAGTSSQSMWPSGPQRGGGDRDREFNKRKPGSTLIKVLKNNNDPRLKCWIAPAVEPISMSATENYTKQVTDDLGYTYTVNVKAFDKLSAEEQAKVLLDCETIPYDFGEYACVGSPVGKTSGTYLCGMYANSDNMGGFDNKRMSNFAGVLKDNANKFLKVVYLEADEVQFLLAEAAAQGWITGSAENYYKTAIRYSCERWGVTSSAINAYLNEPSIQLNAGKGSLDQIATQKWLAFFEKAQESYFDYRRTKRPAIIASEAAAIGNIVLAFPNRMRYPAYEVSNNTDENGKAVTAQGWSADDQNMKMWLLK